MADGAWSISGVVRTDMVASQTTGPSTNAV
jgi:hypothetical protein